MGLLIKQATGLDELEALCRFRYSIYVEEMQRKQIYADHGRKRIEDPLDLTACNLVAVQDDEIVGCVRSNLSRDGGLDDYHAMLRMSDVPGEEFPARTSLCTRLMVRPDFRNSSVLARLFVENFRFGLRSDVRWTFLDCNDHLIELFSRFGFQWTHALDHPEYGRVNAMRLDLLDLDHLKACGSLFAPVLQQWLASPVRFE